MHSLLSMEYYPNLTYQDIKDWINTKTEDELKQTATVYFEQSDEGFPITFIRRMEGSQLYDDGQLVLSVDAEL